MNGKFLSFLTLLHFISILFQRFSSSLIDRFYWRYVINVCFLLSEIIIYIYIIIYILYYIRCIILLLFILLAKPSSSYFIWYILWKNIFFQYVYLYRQSCSMHFNGVQEDFRSQAHHYRRALRLSSRTKQDVFLSDVPSTCQSSTTWRHMDFVEKIFQIFFLGGEDIWRLGRFNILHLHLSFSCSWWNTNLLVMEDVIFFIKFLCENKEFLLKWNVDKLNFYFSLLFSWYKFSLCFYLLFFSIKMIRDYSYSIYISLYILKIYIPGLYLYICKMLIFLLNIIRLIIFFAKNT